jgi:hypothetical protein
MPDHWDTWAAELWKQHEEEGLEPVRVDLAAFAGSTPGEKLAHAIAWAKSADPRRPILLVAPPGAMIFVSWYTLPSHVSLVFDM